MRKNLEGFGPEDKPQLKRKRGSQDRFAFHQCFHGDAWAGLLDLDDGEVGVYWRIILLMYIRRAALPLDYGWLAGQCNIPHQRARARCEALEGKGRIVIDREQRLIYDERALRELVAAERFSEAQQERAKQRGHEKERKPKPELRVVPAEKLADLRAALGENVSGANKAGAPQRSQQREGQRSVQRPPENRISARLSGPQDQAVSVSRGHANHIHTHNNPLTPCETPAAPSPGKPAASPPGGGGGLDARARRAAAMAALEVLKGGAAEADQGMEDDSGSDDAPAQSGDRKAVRT